MRASLSKTIVPFRPIEARQSQVVNHSFLKILPHYRLLKLLLQRPHLNLLNFSEILLTYY